MNINNGHADKPVFFLRMQNILIFLMKEIFLKCMYDHDFFIYNIEENPYKFLLNLVLHLCIVLYNIGFYANN